MNLEVSELSWVALSLDTLPLRGGMVLVFSPAYPKGHPMRIRLMDSQFVRLCAEATHWASVPEPDGTLATSD